MSPTQTRVVDGDHARAQAAALHVVVDDRWRVVVLGDGQQALRSLPEDHAEQRRLLAQRVLAVAADVVEQREQRVHRALRRRRSRDQLRRQWCRSPTACAVRVREFDAHVGVGERVDAVVVGRDRMPALSGEGCLRSRRHGPGVTLLPPPVRGPEVVAALALDTLNGGDHRAGPHPGALVPEAVLLERRSGEPLGRAASPTSGNRSPVKSNACRSVSPAISPAIRPTAS